MYLKQFKTIFNKNLKLLTFITFFFEIRLIDVFRISIYVKYIIFKPAKIKVNTLIYTIPKILCSFYEID